MTGYFSIPVSFCLFSFVSNTNFTEKLYASAGFELAEGNYADQLTTTRLMTGLHGFSVVGINRSSNYTTTITLISHTPICTGH